LSVPDGAACIGPTVCGAAGAEILERSTRVDPVDSTADVNRAPGESAPNDGHARPEDQRSLDHRGSTGAPDQLRQRMDQLPPGHPSSPYNADGSRQQALRLRDLDPATEDDELAHDDRAADKIRPFTDAEWADRLTDIRSRLEKAQADGLATDRQYTIDPDRSRWTRDRRHLQEEIVQSLYEKAGDVPNDHKAIIAGGLAGAGKTTVLGSHAGIDQSQYMTINPDNIKAEMAERGMVPKVEGLSPMEASDLAHEESSYVARQLAFRAQVDGKNIIWDITMSSRATTDRRITELRAADYDQVDGIFVDLPADVSIRRSDERHREGEEKYRSGDGLGGRYVPPEVITAQADPDWGSRNRRTFEELKSRFNQWTRFDNGVDGRDPVLIETGSDHDKLGGTPHDQ
jgi:hypothetical protein